MNVRPDGQGAVQPRVRPADRLQVRARSGKAVSRSKSVYIVQVSRDRRESKEIAKQPSLIREYRSRRSPMGRESKMDAAKPTNPTIVKNARPQPFRSIQIQKSAESP